MQNTQYILPNRIYLWNKFSDHGKCHELIYYKWAHQSLKLYRLAHGWNKIIITNGK